VLAADSELTGLRFDDLDFPVRLAELLQNAFVILGLLVDIVRQTAAEAGRDPEAIEITTGSAAVLGDDPKGAVEELAAQGADRVIVPAFLFMRDTADTLAEFAAKVID
ncbi:MAG: hypothetical protein ACERLM_08595, partial [Acidimicrobiales bacterium]